MHFDRDGITRVVFGSDGGRQITMDISPDDHPALLERWIALKNALATAGEEVMIGMVGLRIPDGPPVPVTYMKPCRICDKDVETEDPAAITYCPDHAPQAHGPATAEG